MAEERQFSLDSVVLGAIEDQDSRVGSAGSGGEYSNSENSESRWSSFNDDELLSEDDSVWKDELDEEAFPWTISHKDIGQVPDFPTGSRRLGMKERVEMLRLRKEINDLNLAYDEQSAEVEEIRREMLKCRQRVSNLMAEKLKVEKELEENKRRDAKAAIQRQCRQLARLEDEIVAEQGVEQEIQRSLRDSEIRLAEVDLLRNSYQAVAENLSETEAVYERQQKEAATVRLENEEHVVAAAEARQAKAEREHAELIRLYQEKHRALVKQAKESKAKSSRFLAETLKRMKKEERLADMERTSQLKRKIKTLVSLKRNVEDSKDSIKALDAIAKQRRFFEKREEIKQRQMSIDNGLNPDEVIMKERRLAEYRNEKREFEQQRRENQVSIVEKLMREHKAAKLRAKKAKQPHWQDKWATKLVKASPVEEDVLFEEELEEKDKETDADAAVELGVQIVQYSLQDEMADEKEGQADGESLLDENDGEKIKQEVNGKHLTSMESGILRSRMNLLKSNAIRPQVAAGRRFEGVAFQSSPQEIVFKDFEVGKELKTTAVLTNVSYTVNYVRFVSISDELEDFMTVQFPPPGPLSAGMTCKITVFFTPLRYCDLHGSIYCEAQTGPVVIPVHCWTKRPVVEIKSTFIQFPITCVGEARKTFLELKNVGSLETHYQIQTRSSQDDGSQLQIDSEAPIEEKEVIYLGKDDVGFLEVGSSIKVPVHFTPSKSGHYSSCREVAFSDTRLEKINIDFEGTAINIPVYIETEIVDLKLCTLNRLYQSSLVVGNRANVAQRIQFDVPHELRDHLEILPKHGLVQADSSFSAQLKFFPRDSLIKSKYSCFDTDTGKLNAPILIHIADQARPLSLHIQATVTNSDLEFDVDCIDFGHCTIYESATVAISLINKSILPQPFGFVHLPEFVDVQPNDGFGTLLPLESLPLDVTFSPNKPKDYKFNLTCRSSIGRDFTVPCEGLGILPILRLSANIVEFRPTALGNSRTTRFCVENPIHGQLSEEVIEGHALPAVTAAFEFNVPDNMPISISPASGIVKPKEKCIVSITFSPQLERSLIQAKAVELLKRKTKFMGEECEVKESGEDVCPISAHQNSPKKKKKASGRKSAGSGSKVAINSSSSVGFCGEKSGTSLSVEPLTDPVVPPPDETCDDYWDGFMSLLESHEYGCLKLEIPCFVAAVSESGVTEERPQDTLYVEINAPSVRPKLIVVSNHGRTTIDFGQVCRGHQEVRTILLQNISEEFLKLSHSFLDPDGTFEMRNALRTLSPRQKHSMQIAFSPAGLGKYYETLKIYYDDSDSSMDASSLDLCLVGSGVSPSIELSLHRQDYLDMGDLFVGDVSRRTFTVSNTSSISAHFWIRLDSSLASRSGGWKRDGSQFQTGVSNQDGSPVFDVVPMEGCLPPGQTKEIVVKFSPSRASGNYLDTARIEFSTQDEAQAVCLAGRCWDCNLYTCGWEDFSLKMESLAAGMGLGEGGSEGKSTAQCVSLTFRSLGGQSVSRQIEIGNIKSQLIKKPGGEFSFDPLPAATAKYFQIEHMKASVEAGQKKTVAISFHPSKDCPDYEFISAFTTLTLRGEKSQQYKVILRGIVKSPLLA